MVGLSTDSAQHKPPLAIYIHWPFCKKKCPYCDFNSHVRAAIDTDAWRTALLAELRHWHPHTSGHMVTSIFFGGGTPSLMPPDIAAALIEEVRRLWFTSAELEITLEANPTSVEAANFAALAQAGVNRVSLGVQSLRDDALAFLGRQHSAREALEAVALAKTHFARMSFDLIYALPNQTLAGWQAELKEALRHAGTHLSAYQLTIEENTAFHHAYHVAKQFALPQDSTAAELYECTTDTLGEAGLLLYEISNHAVPGHECRHNLSYWRSDAYLGIGPGAHGRVNRPEGRCATRTIKSPERWLEAVHGQSHGIEESLLLTPQEHLEEIVLMGLRLTREGLRIPESFRAQWYTPARSICITRLTQEGLIETHGNMLRATPRGRLLLNYITAQLIAA